MTGKITMFSRILIAALIMHAPILADAAPDNITIGALAFGTVNWELEAIHNEGLDKKHGLELDVRLLANPDAGKIGLQANSLDIIATDWIWVSHQRQQGADFKFIPFSTQAGAVMASATGPIRSLADIRGKRLGVAGGGLDKNWLLLKTYATRQIGLDLEHDAQPVFAAPPLLNQQLQDGKLDALLTYWHFAARQEAQGNLRILDGRDVIRGLGIEVAVPNLGYVFKNGWALKHGKALDSFIAASDEARSLLCNSEPVWNKIAPITQESDANTLKILRRDYCAGIVKQWGTQEKAAIAKIYQLLRETGGEALTGAAQELPTAIFWR
jgi:NitT/TauT family transport system substrate-binding protein